MSLLICFLGFQSFVTHEAWFVLRSYEQNIAMVYSSKQANFAYNKQNIHTMLCYFSDKKNNYICVFWCLKNKQKWFNSYWWYQNSLPSFLIQAIQIPLSFSSMLHTIVHQNNRCKCISKLRNRRLLFKRRLCNTETFLWP